VLDIKYICDHQEQVIDAIINKHIKLEFFDGTVNRSFGAEEFVSLLLETDSKRRQLRSTIDQLRMERNELTQAVQGADSKSREALVEQVRTLKSKLSVSETELDGVERDYSELMLRVPSVPSSSVPLGTSDSDNVVVREWGNVPSFDFDPKDHLELAEKLDIMDIPRGVKLAGPRSYFLKNEGVLLELAVCRLALDRLMEKGFELFSVPLLVKDHAMVGTGFYPGGEDQAYRVEKDQLSLIGTSEVSVTSYHADEILDIRELPRLYAGYSACFRREAGTYGKDTRGAYRVHQFHKVEQVVLCEADESRSQEMHELILGNSEEILQLLGLPYRVVIVCAGEMGQGQVFKNDIETWMPSRNGYGETHSCSTLHDFQSRRLNIKYRDGEGKIRFVHTLNNTAIASPRILIPILEVYQESDGSVMIPEALRPYMGGKDRIVPRAL
jgi:seryl-tRNA synthetase